MSVLQLPLHPALSRTSRFAAVISESVSARATDWLLLVTYGAVAAITSAELDLGIRRVPGHAILNVIFPISLGLSLVPRRGSGTVMGCSALITAILLRLNGVKSDGLGLGALTSLLATGPILDVTLRRSRGGWKQYLLFAGAGLSSNILALIVRGTAKATGFEAPGRRPLGEWLSQAVVTYLLSGLAAGLISGIILFRRRQTADTSQQETST